MGSWVVDVRAGAPSLKGAIQENRRLDLSHVVPAGLQKACPGQGVPD
jgi:hypothetical protein